MSIAQSREVLDNPIIQCYKIIEQNVVIHPKARKKKEENIYF